MSIETPKPAKMPEDKHPASIASLITSLTDLRKAQPKAIRSSVHLYPPSIYAPESSADAQARERRITSWKMTEHMYYNAQNPFPTLARGLFTEEVEEGDPVPVAAEEVEGDFGDGQKRVRIVARGYDKFFNVDEVTWTNWESMQQHTEPPYRLTLKSNGCLILISALTPGHLVVASKHSLGTTTEPEPELEPEPKPEPEPTSTPEPIPQPEPIRVTEAISALEPSQHEAPAVLPLETEKNSSIAVSQEDEGDDEAKVQPSEILQARKGETPDIRNEGDLSPAPGDLDDVPLITNESLDLFGEGDKKPSKSSQKKQAKAAQKAMKKEAQKEQIAPKPKVQTRPARARITNDENGEREAQAHAEVGRQWVRRTLDKNDKTEAELARRLWDGNMSAVLELCDDSFEEHVIATPEYWTGLHLHGLNLNSPHFATAPPSEVSALAQEFGFIPTKYVEFQTLEEVKRFTQDVAESGTWEGDMIEGFVIRSTVRDTGEEVIHGKPPYRPGSPFFFKVKFDEPYLLYRQWREVTRAMLPLLKPGIQATAVEEVWKRVRTKVKRSEVAVYTDWAAATMQSEPGLFEDYDRGVVRVRERFLAWIEEGDGQQAWKEGKEGTYKLKSGKIAKVDKTGLPKKYVIVPISVPGTGKTLIGLALNKLYGFGHTQSDDITTKRSAPGFLKNITNLLLKQDVVFADRNNHIDKHYTEIFHLNSEKQLRSFDIQLIGMIWDMTSQPHNKILRICSERVIQRGDNHQTLRPDSTGLAEHEAVISKFMRDWEEPDPEMFQSLITVQVEDDPLECLRKVLGGLKDVLGLEGPDDARLLEVLEEVKEYRTTTPYHPPILKMGQAIRYYAISVEDNLHDIVDRALKSRISDERVETGRRLFERLVKGNRIVWKPHITLCHREEVKAERERLGLAELDGTQGPDEKDGAGDQESRVVSKGNEKKLSAEAEAERTKVLADATRGETMVSSLSIDEPTTSDKSSHDGIPPPPSIGPTEAEAGGSDVLADATHKEKMGSSPSIDEPSTSEKSSQNEIPPPPSIGPEEQLWERCKTVAQGRPCMFDFRLTHLVWDDRVMTLFLTDLHPRDELGVGLDLPEELYRQLHVTVGTVAEDVRPRESLGLILAVRDKIGEGEDEGEVEEVVKGGGKVRWIKLDEVKGVGRIKGMW